MVGLSGEKLKKRPMENGQCSISVGGGVKWKPRKVSAVRDFPPGCGADCLPDNMTHLEAVAPFIFVNEKIGNEGGNVVESPVLGVEVADIDRMVEKIVMENNMEYGFRNGDSDDGVVENNGVGLAEEVNDVEVGDLVEKEQGGQEGRGLVKEEVHEMEVDARELSNGDLGELNSDGNIHLGIGSKRKFPKRRVSAVRDFPPFCGWNAPALTEDERLKITGKTSLVEENKDGLPLNATEAVVGEVCRGNVQGVIVEGSDMKEAVLESANMYEEDKSSGVVDKGEAMIEDCEESAQDDTINQKNINQAKGLEEKLGNEMVVYSREKPLNRKPSKRTFLGSQDLVHVREVEIEKSESKIGSEEADEDVDKQGDKEGMEIVVYSGGGEPLKSFCADDAGGLECEMEERVIVQGLMASANCPWKQGQKSHTKPDNIISRSKSKRSAQKVVDGEKSGKRKSKSAGKGKVTYVSTSLDMVLVNEEDIVANDDEEKNEDFPNKEARDFDVNLPPFGPKSSTDARNRVRETLRLFQAVCRKILQGEESKTKQGEEYKPKQNKRIDLAAAKIVQARGKEVNAGNKIIGAVPGVEIGDEFQFRVELALVGVHRPYQAGIDYIIHGDSKDKICTSIVASGGYDDELDNPDILIYSGSGGVSGKDKKPEDQKLERGNLALKNSVSMKNPVRVIRGSKETKASELSDAKSKLVATYVYDGLYTVERYWQESGPKGGLVFKFELKRIPGQPEIAWKEVKRAKKLKSREGVCVDDISGGKELNPICAVNTIDNEKPPEFNYITKMIYPSWYNPIPPIKGCGCAKQCYDRSCACASKNGGELPYNRNGAIVEIKQLVYECGPSCKCPPTCYNRVSQHGIKVHLEIFKTETRGWGVRSLNSISSGSFICEYIGELLEDTEAERRKGNDEYLFDIGRNFSDCSVANSTSNEEAVEEGEFTIDAAEFGNVGRFVNHSCSPNLYAQNVLYDQEDKRFPHIMLFAAENIPPLQELTYHYNYQLDDVRDSNGDIKIKSCFCGSSECAGRLY